MKYNYLFATDMDYTLLMPGQDVPEENVRACKALKENGVAFTISTGRSSFLVGKYAEKLEIDVPLITGNGGALFDPIARKDVFSADFDDKKFRKLLKRFIDEEVNATIYSTTGIYFCPASTRKFFCIDYNKDVPEEKKAPLFDITKESLDGDLPKFNKFLIIDAPSDLEEELRNDKDLELVSSGPSFYDVMCAGVSKGNALLTLADMLEIPRENTFGIGDSENDLSLISMAKYGISMSNGSDACKKAAQYITTSCEENGFAKAVFEYVLPIVKANK